MVIPIGTLKVAHGAGAHGAQVGARYLQYNYPTINQISEVLQNKVNQDLKLFPNNILL